MFILHEELPFFFQLTMKMTGCDRFPHNLLVDLSLQIPNSCNVPSSSFFLAFQSIFLS